MGSSSGSGAAVAANLAMAALGTETDGSLVTPSAANCLVCVKPTVGLTSRAGVIPISFSQDTVGPMCRTVADAAAILTVIAGPDPRDPATRVAPTIDYTRFLDATALRGARIGIPRRTFFGYSEKADAVVDEAIAVMAREGAVIVDPADIPNSQQLTFLGPELTVLLHEFKDGINRYLGTLGPDVRAHSLKDLIAFNEAHAEREMPYFGQELFHMADAVGPLTDPGYREALEQNRMRARRDGLDAVFATHRLDALVMPTVGPPWKIDLVTGDHIQGLGSSPAAQAGYPLVGVPAGFSHDLPVGLIFGGLAFSEARLIALAYAFEQAHTVRIGPRFRSPT
jgi:amidase